MKTDRSEPEKVVPTAVMARRILVFAGMTAALSTCAAVATIDVLPFAVGRARGLTCARSSFKSLADRPSPEQRPPGFESSLPDGHGLRLVAAGATRRACARMGAKFRRVPVANIVGSYPLAGCACLPVLARGP